MKIIRTKTSVLVSKHYCPVNGESDIKFWNYFKKYMEDKGWIPQLWMLMLCIISYAVVNQHSGMLLLQHKQQRNQVVKQQDSLRQEYTKYLEFQLWLKSSRPSVSPGQ